MFSWPTSILKTGELVKRRTELERQMRALDLQVAEFQRQVSAVAGQEARLKMRLAALSAGDAEGSRASAEQTSRKFMFVSPVSGCRTAIKTVLDRKPLR